MCDTARTGLRSSTRLRNIAGVAGLALGFAFGAVAVIIIGATITHGRACSC